MRMLESRVRGCRVLSIVILTWGLAAPGQAADGIWMREADMPTARLLLGTCTVDGMIYAIGGASRPHVSVSTVEVYDPAIGTWRTRRSMPAARGGLGISAVGGKIYAIGGGAGTRSTFEYDPTTDVWVSKQDMPTGRTLLSTSVVNGKIYAIGGAMDTGGPAFTAVEEYDPVTDTWTRKANLPERRFYHTAGVVDGKIYVIGGSWQSWTASSKVFEYDPATDTWQRKANAPTARSWLSPNAGVVDGRIYVMGGDFGPPKANVEEYDPMTDTWSIRADMPNPRGALSTTALDGTIYVIGGTVSLFNDTSAITEAYTPNPLIVDFNGDGIVNFRDFCGLANCWGANTAAMDIGPRPFGDGVVDIFDVSVLADHWLDDNRLIAHWKLDESTGAAAQDSVGNCEGLLVNGPQWQPGDGVVDGALAFDGIDDYVYLPFVLNPSDGPFSVFMWVKGGGPGQVMVSQMDTSGDWKAWLCCDAGSGTLGTELQFTGRGGLPLGSDAAFSDGQWHRVGLVWDGSCRHLYIDGVEVAADVEPQGALGSLRSSTFIGVGSGFGPGSHFSGLIDDVRVYDRAVQP